MQHFGISIFFQLLLKEYGGEKNTKVTNLTYGDSMGAPLSLFKI